VAFHRSVVVVEWEETVQPRSHNVSGSSVAAIAVHITAPQEDRFSYRRANREVLLQVLIK
jgi:hypothetical protein